MPKRSTPMAMGLLDLIDVPGFDPNASGSRTSATDGIQDLDGANLLTNLQSLDLGGNQITSIESGDFEGLANLQTLGLYGNQITSIESGDFEGLDQPADGLTWTAIKSRASRAVPSRGSPTCRRFDLDGNQITSIESGDFEGLTNLQCA